MSELAILLARVRSISKFSANLPKCLLKISASSSLLVIALLLLFKIIDLLAKRLLQEEKTNSFPKSSIVGDNSMI